MFFQINDGEYILRKLEKYGEVLQQFQKDEFMDFIEIKREFRNQSLNKLKKYRDYVKNQKNPVYFWQFR